MSLTLYGIKACDTMKKARAWLDAAAVSYRFHDYKTEGVQAKDVQRWCAGAGVDRVLNRSGTTFRNLPPAAKEALTLDAAVALMVAQPSMIKRPILEGGGLLLVGFSPESYAAMVQEESR